MRLAGAVLGGSGEVREAPWRLLEIVGGSRRAQEAPGRLQEVLGRLQEPKMEAPGGTPDRRASRVRGSWDPLILKN